MRTKACGLAGILVNLEPQMFGAEWQEGGVVNKQKAILIRRAAVEDLISFICGYISFSLSHTDE